MWAFTAVNGLFLLASIAFSARAVDRLAASPIIAYLMIDCDAARRVTER